MCVCVLYMLWIIVVEFFIRIVERNENVVVFMIIIIIMMIIIGVGVGVDVVMVVVVDWLRDSYRPTIIISKGECDYKHSPSLVSSPSLWELKK